MKSLIEQQIWSPAEAIAYIAIGQIDPMARVHGKLLLDSIGTWLADRVHNPAPTNSQRVIKRIERFVAAAEALPGWKGCPTLELSPVVWLWFVRTNAKAAVAPEFLQGLDAWIVGRTLLGEIPVAQFHDKPLGWPQVRLQEGFRDLRLGVPLSTLLLRPFDSCQPHHK